MIGVDKNASTRASAVRSWLKRGEGVAKAAAAVVRGMNRWLWRSLSALGQARARRLAMRELHALDDRMLWDIGLSRDQVGVTVDAMIEGNNVARATQPFRKLEAADTDEVAALDASNERRYKTAA